MPHKQLSPYMLFVAGVMMFSNVYGIGWWGFQNKFASGSDFTLFFTSPFDETVSYIKGDGALADNLIPINLKDLQIRSTGVGHRQSESVLDENVKFSMDINRSRLENGYTFQRGNGRIIIRVHGVGTSEAKVFFPEEGNVARLVDAEDLGRGVAEFLNKHSEVNIKEVYLDCSGAELGTGQRFTQSFFENFAGEDDTIVTYRNGGGTGTTRPKDGKLMWTIDGVGGEGIDKGEFYLNGKIPEEYKHLFTSKNARGETVDRDEWLSSRQGACASP